MCQELLNRRDRIQRCFAALGCLQKLRCEWESIQKEDLPTVQIRNREKLKIIEAEISVLRLRQAESRLLQQLFTVLIGTGIGSAITLLVQFVIHK